MNVEEIKEECIQIDITNIGSNGFDTKAEVLAHYKEISLKKLLHYYYHYMGLFEHDVDCKKEGYSIEIDNLLKFLSE